MLNLLLLHSDVSDMFSLKLVLLGMLIFPVALFFVWLVSVIQDSRWYMIWKGERMVTRERRMNRDRLDDEKNKNVPES